MTNIVGYKKKSPLKTTKRTTSQLENMALLGFLMANQSQAMSVQSQENLKKKHLSCPKVSFYQKIWRFQSFKKSTK
jgi:hypothetical protein